MSDGAKKLTPEQQQRVLEFRAAKANQRVMEGVPKVQSEPSFVTYEPPEPEPERSIPVSRGEAIATDASQGATLGLGEPIGAAGDAVRNWLRAAQGGTDLLSGAPAETAGRGIGAQLKGFDEYLATRRQRRQEGRERFPAETAAANIVAGGPAALAIPPLRASQGSGLAGRIGAGMGNVVTDAAIGGGVAAAEAAPGERMQAARQGAGMAAGMSTLLRTPGMAAGGGDAARRTALSILPEDVRPSAERLSAMGPSGRASRASARAGARGLDDTQRQLTGLVDETEELADVVLDYGKIGMKREPIAKAIGEDGVAVNNVQAVADSLAEVTASMAQGAEQMAGVAERGPGLLALKRMQESITNTLKKVDALEGDDMAAQASEVFMELDNLKRQIGKNVKTATSGRGDPMVADYLKGEYEKLRQVLENEQLWGPQAAGIQREVNAAWTPWIRKRGPFAREALARDSGIQGADPWTTRPVGDPAKIGSALRGAGTPDMDLRERHIREGLESTSNLVRTLSEQLDLPPEMRAKASRVGDAVNEFLGSFEQTRGNLVAAREARDVAAESPKLGKVINVTGAAEDLLSRGPLGAASRVVGSMAGLAEPVRKAVAMHTGRNTGPMMRAAQEDPEIAARIADEDPETQRSRVVDLNQTDDEFRARQRERARRETDQ